ncbi:hypothetical protein ACFRU3_14690 [Streptomyces sp. NPDC056910]|uniref:hypothetical protein n=2 Tax=Streptomyces TaxID=1883 RepID=UPI0036B42A3B
MIVFSTFATAGGKTEDPREDMTRGGLSVGVLPGDRVTMPESKPMHCHTCKGKDRPHRPLNKAEREWLKKTRGQKNADGYFLCTEEGCRHPRTTFKKNPFADEFRIPDVD